MLLKVRGAWHPPRHGTLALLLAVCLSCGAQTSTETADISVESVRKSLAREHASIAAHPKDPTNYIELAYTLIDAGAGEQARAAAAEAVRVSPASALAFSAQGWILRHNNIGVDFGRGFDYDGALRAYRRAVELDPTNVDTREALGNLLEFNREGIQYAPDAERSSAIDEYRYVTVHQPTPSADALDNLAIALFYSGRYDEAIYELTGHAIDDKGVGALLASVAAAKGSGASIALSGQVGGDEQRRKDALHMAAEGLWNRGLYAQAADLLTASLPDTANGPAVSQQIQLFRDLKPFVPANLPASDPRQPVQRLMEAAFMGNLSRSLTAELISRHSYATEAAWSHALQQSDTIAGILLAIMRQTGLPRRVIADIGLSRMKITVPDERGRGAPVRVQVTGIAPEQFFVTLEDNVWKIASSGKSPEEVGLQTLFLLKSGDHQTASALLTWHYGLLQPSRETGDPLSGDLFVRLWAPSVRASSEEALFAAAALVFDANVLSGIAPAIEKAREETRPGSRRTDLDQLLATVTVRLGDAAKSRAIVARLLEQYPQSNAVLHLAGQVYKLEHDWAAWQTLLTTRLKAEPDERSILLESAAEAEAEGNYAHAREAYQAILNGNHAAPEDYTTYAWLSLFEGKPDDKALAAAQQATMSASSRKYASLLTMACVHAARRDTSEAHQELLEAMSSANLEQPDAGIWYGFGQIFEQYGLLDAAVSAYRQSVSMAEDANPRSLPANTLDVGTLARLRLAALTAR